MDDDMQNPQDASSNPHADEHLGVGGEVGSRDGNGAPDINQDGYAGDENGENGDDEYGRDDEGRTMHDDSEEDMTDTSGGRTDDADGSISDSDRPASPSATE